MRTVDTKARHSALAKLTRDELLAAVEEWLPGDFDFRVATKCEEGDWFALALDFDVTGKGSTRAAAIRQMGELLAIYLAAYFADGASFESTVRPVPASLRFRIQVESALGHLILRPLAALPLSRSLSREDNYILPVSEVAVHATC